MNNTLNTTAGLFIEESDDENQDDDIKDESQNQHRPLRRSHRQNQNHNQSLNSQGIHSQSSLGSLGISQSQNDQNHDDYDYDDDEDDVQLSLREQVIYLTTAWRNEKLSPEILQYEDDMVEAVKEAIDEREEMIEDAEEEIANNAKVEDGGNKILSASQYWYRKEVERIRFILHSYLRVRLWKIQKYTLYFLSDEESWNRLSAAEQQFATNYSSLGERHFKDCFLRDLPKKYQKIDDREMLVVPDLRKFVVFQANEDRENVMIENGKHHVNLQKGNIFVASYTNFKHLVYDGVVDLI